MSNDSHKDAFPEVFAAVEVSMSHSCGTTLMPALNNNTVAQLCIGLEMSEDEALEYAKYQVQALYAYAAHDGDKQLEHEADIIRLLQDVTDIDPKYLELKLQEYEGKDDGIAEEYREALDRGDMSEFLLDMLTTSGALVCEDCSDEELLTMVEDEEYGPN